MIDTGISCTSEAENGNSLCLFQTSFYKSSTLKSMQTPKIDKKNSGDTTTESTNPDNTTDQCGDFLDFKSGPASVNARNPGCSLVNGPCGKSTVDEEELCPGISEEHAVYVDSDSSCLYVIDSTCREFLNKSTLGRSFLSQASPDTDLSKELKPSQCRFIWRWKGDECLSPKCHSFDVIPSSSCSSVTTSSDSFNFHFCCLCKESFLLFSKLVKHLSDKHSTTSEDSPDVTTNEESVTNCSGCSAALIVPSEWSSSHPNSHSASNSNNSTTTKDAASLMFLKWTGEKDLNEIAELSKSTSQEDSNDMISATIESVLSTSDALQDSANSARRKSHLPDLPETSSMGPMVVADSPSILSREDIARNLVVASELSATRIMQKASQDAVRQSALSGLGPTCSLHPEGKVSGVECPKCDVVLGSSRSLGGHMTMMHSRNSCKTLKCPKCNWHYKYPETLEIHMKEKHRDSETVCHYCISNQPHPRLARGETYSCGYKPYRCEICKYSTTTKGNLSIHMQSDKHLNNVQEIQQGNVLPDPTAVLYPGKQGSTGSRGLSPVNASVNTSGASPNPHGGSSSPKTPSFLPPAPNAVASIANAMDGVGSQGSKSKPTVHRCDICNYETSVPRNLRIHMTSEKHNHNALMMQQQGAAAAAALSSFAANLASSRGLNTLPGNCATSGTEEAILAALASGALLSPEQKALMNECDTTNLNNSLNCDSKLFLCAICGQFSCDTLEEMQAHIQEDRSQPRDSDISLVGGYYVCNLCTYKSHLKANFQLHTKTDKHLQKLQLMNHIREGGPGNEWRAHLVTANNANTVILKCNACNTFANSVHKLQLHVNSVPHHLMATSFSTIQSTKLSSDKDYYFCNICHYASQKSVNMLGHLSAPRHVSELTNLCSSIDGVGDPSFRAAVECIEVRVLSNSNEAPVNLEIDNNEDSAISAPEKECTDESKYDRCPLCSTTVKSRSLMRQHLGKVHKVDDPNTLERLLTILSSQDSSEDSSEDAKNLENGPNAFQCSKCPRSFATPVELFDHQSETNHISIKSEPGSSSRYLCWEKRCNQYFKSLKAVQAHFKEIHVRKAGLQGALMTKRSPGDSDSRSTFDKTSEVCNGSGTRQNARIKLENDAEINGHDPGHNTDSGHLLNNLKEEPPESMHLTDEVASMLKGSGGSITQDPDTERPSLMKESLYRCNICRFESKHVSGLETHLKTVSHESRLARVHQLVESGELDRNIPFLEGPHLNATNDNWLFKSNLMGIPTSASHPASFGMLPFGGFPPFFPLSCFAAPSPPVSQSPATNYPQVSSSFSKEMTCAQLTNSTALTTPPFALQAPSTSSAQEPSAEDPKFSNTAMLRKGGPNRLPHVGVGQTNRSVLKRLLQDYGLDIVQQYNESRLQRRKLKRPLSSQDAILGHLRAPSPKSPKLEIAESVDEAKALIKAMDSGRANEEEEDDDEAKCQCTGCGKSFSSVWILKAHIEQIHKAYMPTDVLEEITQQLVKNVYDINAPTPSTLPMESVEDSVQVPRPECSAPPDEENKNEVPTSRTSPAPSNEDSSAPSNNFAPQTSAILTHGLQNTVTGSTANLSALTAAAAAAAAVQANSAAFMNLTAMESTAAAMAAAAAASNPFSNMATSGLTDMSGAANLPLWSSLAAMTAYSPLMNAAAAAAAYPFMANFPGLAFSSQAGQPPLDALSLAAAAAAASGFYPPTSTGNAQSLPPSGSKTPRPQASATPGAQQSSIPSTGALTTQCDSAINAAAVAASMAAVANSAAAQHHHQQQQQKRARTKITEEQLKILRQYFDINNSPTEEQVEEMVQKSGLNQKVIKHWFRNTLFKERQRNKDSPYNFSVPPSLGIDLEQYEKTGEARIFQMGESSSDIAKEETEREGKLMDQGENGVKDSDGPLPKNEEEQASTFDENIVKVEPTPTSAQSTTKLDTSPVLNTDFMAQLMSASLALASLKAINTPDAFRQLTGVSTVTSNMTAPSLLTSGHLSGSSEMLAQPDTALSQRLRVDLSRCGEMTSPPSPHSSICSNNSNDAGSGTLVRLSSTLSPGSNSYTASGRRANRTRFREYQIKAMQEFFERNAYPKDDDLEALSSKLGLSPRVIVVWFQNARQKARKLYENQPSEEDTEGALRTPGHNYQCKKCSVVFQRYYEFIKHKQNVCYKEDTEQQRLLTSGGNIKPEMGVNSAPSEENNKDAIGSESTKDGLKQVIDDVFNGVVSGGETECGDGNGKYLSASLECSPTETTASSSKRLRTQISPHQLSTLFRYYNEDTNPSGEALERISLDVGLEKRVIQVWFQNTRARDRKGQLSSRQPGCTNDSSFSTCSCPFCGSLYHSRQSFQEHILKCNQSSSSKSGDGAAALRASSNSPSSCGAENSDSSSRIKLNLNEKYMNQLLIASPDISKGEEGDLENNSIVDVESIGDAGPPTSAFKAMLNKLSEQKNFAGQLNSPEENAIWKWLRNGASSVGLETPSTNGNVELNGTKTKCENVQEGSTSEDQAENAYCDQDGRIWQNHNQALSPGVHGQGIPKRYRTHLTAVQIKIMKKLFEEFKTPSMAECERVGAELGLQKRVVQVWFQNARAKERRGKSSGSSPAPVISKCGAATLCSLCGITYTSKHTVQDHIFTVQHIRKVKEHLKETEGMSESPKPSVNPAALQKLAEATISQGVEDEFRTGDRSHKSSNLAQSAAAPPAFSTSGSEADAFKAVASWCDSQGGKASSVSAQHQQQLSSAAALTAQNLLAPYFCATNLSASAPAYYALTAGNPAMSFQAGLSPTLTGGVSSLWGDSVLLSGTAICQLQVPEVVKESITKALGKKETQVQFTQDGKSFQDTLASLSQDEVLNLATEEQEVGWTCRSCQNVFQSSQYYAAHRSISRVCSQATPALPLVLVQTHCKCNKCQQSFSTQEEYLSHLHSAKHKRVTSTK